MGNDVKEEPGMKILPGGGDGGQGHRRGGQRGRHRWNNPAGTGGTTGSATTSSKFPTRSKDIPDNVVFDNSGQVDAANFQRSLKGMANYFHTTYSAEVSDAIVKMEDVVITVEDEPTLRKDSAGADIPLTSWEEYRWKKTYAEQSGKLKTYTESMPKAYILIYNQCSTSLKNDLETSTSFPTVDACKDPIGLLKIIQGLCCSYDSKTQSVMATVASQKKLFTFFQRDGMDNVTYHREFMAHVETIKTYGGMGAIGITPTFVAQKLQEMVTAGTCQDSANPTKAELAEAQRVAQDEFLACLMLSGANKERFGPLRNELANQFAFGIDHYPKTPDACLQMMNRRRDGNVARTPRGPPPPPAREPAPKQEEEALVFAQDSDRKPPRTSKSDTGSRTSSSSGSISGSSRKTRVVICKTCGQQGHASTDCPLKQPPAQIHATVGALPPDDASESSGDGEFTYHIMTQVAEPFVPKQPRTYAEVLLTQHSTSHPGATVLAQGASSSPRRPINKDLVLLDSQSTVHLFSQPDHVTNIRDAGTPIRVHCNKGTLETTQVADFGDTPVYFDSRGIANVLSLYQLGQKFKVTYDSTDRDGVFKVFTPAGVIEFKPTVNGLHAINLRDNPDAAFVLVNDPDLAYESPIRTVRKNYEGFTKKQVQQATTARRIMSMIGAPTESEYQGLVRLNLNMLPDCPLTNTDIVNAHKIFDTDLANLRGKTVRRRPPEHVSGEIIDIPQQILDNQSNVTLAADVMFVNGVPFLVSSSRNINLTTIEHAPQRTASKLGFLLTRILTVYARAGFRVRVILMDNEFEKVKDHVPQAPLNITAASEHVGDIERRIRVIKERCRGILNTLPYSRIPWIMLIHLIHYVVMWLNNFPVANGVSTQFSPREIILRHKLTYKHHCRALFGSYCEVHEDPTPTPTNSMKPRTIPTICLGPTGNIQGTHSFLNLLTGLVIKRRRFTELPAPDSVIARVVASVNPIFDLVKFI